MVPLFPGVPGGPELLVVLLLLVALFGVPLVVAVLGIRHLRGDTESLSDLEARVRELEDELDTNGTTASGPSGDENGSDDAARGDPDNPDRD